MSDLGQAALLSGVKSRNTALQVTVTSWWSTYIQDVLIGHGTEQLTAFFQARFS